MYDFLHDGNLSPEHKKKAVTLFGAKEIIGHSTYANSAHIGQVTVLDGASIT